MGAIGNRVKFIDVSRSHTKYGSDDRSGDVADSAIVVAIDA